jgi:hypothetical protein
MVIAKETGSIAAIVGRKTLMCRAARTMMQFNPDSTWKPLYAVSPSAMWAGSFR